MRHSALALLTLLLVCACSTSPLGRNQLIMVSEGEMTQLGAASFAEMKQKIPQSKDSKTSGYVVCVANAITAEVGGSQKWEVQVFDDKQVNAFALPGGKIGVYTGLLKVAATQDQLAAVIGHEIAHVLARHSAERMSTAMAAQVGTVAVQAATGVNGQLLGLAGNVFFTLPNSRTQESEADLMGLDLMSKAGFDPRASVKLWQNMSKAGGQKPPEMLSTHPSDSTRIQQLEARIPANLPTYEQARAQGKRPRCG